MIPESVAAARVRWIVSLGGTTGPTRTVVSPFRGMTDEVDERENQPEDREYDPPPAEKFVGPRPLPITRVVLRVCAFGLADARYTTSRKYTPSANSARSASTESEVRIE
jgi:hypothetical protein